jgi:hypothetical protein
MGGIDSGIYLDIGITVWFWVIIFSVFGRVFVKAFFFFRLRICSLVLMMEPVSVVNLTDIRPIAIYDLRGRLCC